MGSSRCLSPPLPPRDEPREAGCSGDWLLRSQSTTRVTTDVPVKNPNLTWKEFSANEVSHSMSHYLVTLRDGRRLLLYYVPNEEIWSGVVLV